MTLRSDVYGYLDGNMSVPVYLARALPMMVDKVPFCSVNVSEIAGTFTGTKEFDAEYANLYSIQITAVVPEGANWADEAEAILGEAKAILLPEGSSFNNSLPWNTNPEYLEQYNVDTDGEIILGIGLLTIQPTDRVNY